MLKSVFTAALLGVISSVSIAADLPSKTSAPSMLSSQKVVDWSGSYGGLTVGGQYSSSAMHDGDEWLTYGNLDGSAVGFNAGGTLGFNRQSGSFVYGIEADASFAPSDTGHVNGWDEAYYVSTKTNWLATVRARAGIASSNYLVYVTGGAAFLNSQHNATYDDYACDVSGEGGYCKTATEAGLAFGGGLEVMIEPKISVKAEYVYIAMPTLNVFGKGDAPYSWTDSQQVARVGVNYHF